MIKEKQNNRAINYFLNIKKYLFSNISDVLIIEKAK